MRRPSIEIVTHCWSGDAVPIYHRLLDYQLTSIKQLNAATRLSDEFDVVVTVVYTQGDHRTVEVVQRHTTQPAQEGLIIRGINLTLPQLFYRAIGRNIVAKSSLADVVWFTDCDYIFTPGSLRTAHQRCLTSDAQMIYPRFVNVHKTHALGDRLIAGGHFDFDPDDFAPREERMAIGGIQIVKGDWCRTKGYLDGSRWTRIVDVENETVFVGCRCDKAMRQAVGKIERVEIPGVFRIRHSRAGRNPEVDHGEQTR